MERLSQTFGTYQRENRKLLSVYLTAGYPMLDDTVAIIESLERVGVGLVEIGMPFSDPMADGPVIQQTSAQALKNGMNTQLLFEQLSGIRQRVSLPLLLMGYWNPVLQFGVEAFCAQCRAVGIDGVILPDLPPEVYERDYKYLFESYGLAVVFLISPQTPEHRVRYLDGLSRGFLYLVSSPGVTGAQTGFPASAQNYFQRIAKMELRNPVLVGFGVHDADTFAQASAHHAGAIVGSAFVQMLGRDGLAGIPDFVDTLTKS